MRKREIEKLKKEKAKRMKSYSRYGHAGALKHSTMGMKSCVCGGVCSDSSALYCNFVFYPWKCSCDHRPVWNLFRSRCCAWDYRRRKGNA